MATAQEFSTEDAKVVLRDILETFTIPENQVRMEEARDNAGNDMMKVMQMVFPVATQIQMDVIQRYGFPGDGDGIIRFAQTIKVLEKQDATVAELNSKLKSIVMPPMGAPPAMDSPAS
ncbi:protein C10 [Lingula anatina]|uniref:Protein C10 n=1 Tax=Lingula anatina TaxID=7574 RepID=A0A1S3JUW0_LINAN|nr:protein C10 [Lingula anatina]|eukprot:XP_013414113.1 protein C10 [Lingula anatina]